MIYLSGKMSGIPDYNFPEFWRVAKKLETVGLAVYNPAAEDSLPGTDQPDPKKTEGVPRDVFLRRDIQFICSPDCEGVIALPSWKNSEGAKLELAVARQLGLRVWEYRDAEYGLYDEDERDADEEEIFPADIEFLLSPMESPVTLVAEAFDDDEGV